MARRFGFASGFRRPERVVLEPLLRDVTTAPRPSGYTLSLLSAPITRVDWDRLQSAGLDPAEWFERFPQSQRRTPPINVVERDGLSSARYRAGANVTVVRYPRPRG